MKTTILALAAAFLLSSCSENNQESAPTTEKTPQTQTASIEADHNTAQAAVSDIATEATAARESVKALGAALKGELTQAMKNGGPLAALTVCNEKAPALAAKISSEQGITVSRVSEKNRNPNNAPNEWQTSVLADFEKRKAAGEDPSTLEYAQKVDNEFRYMKAIPTGGVCLNCHGATLKPVIADKIKALYPEDKAIGFNVGDIRGAFVAVKSN